MIPSALVRQGGRERGIKADTQLPYAMTSRSLRLASELALNGGMAAAGRILHYHRQPAEFGHRDVGQRRMFPAGALADFDDIDPVADGEQLEEERQ
jgi:hypothetical protein